MIQGSTIFRQWHLLTALFACLTAIPLHAALGDTVTSVQSDARQMKASVQVRQAANYSVHELQATGGTTVREFVSPEGKVFAVAWEGPAPPDLQQLLGSYYQKAVEAVQASKSQRVGRHPVSVQQPDLVIQISGHQRSFSGRAYLPNMMPDAVSREQIR
jgi:hypothetical protein